MQPFVKCCEHNRCPYRPTRWLGRFTTRPWYCPQCERLWVTEYNSDYINGYYQWKELNRETRS